MFKPTKPQHIVNKSYADNNSGGGAFIITVRDEDYFLVLDKTFDEIFNAMRSGIPCIVKGDLPVVELYRSNPISVASVVQNVVVTGEDESREVYIAIDNSSPTLFQPGSNFGEYPSYYYGD